MGPLLQSPVKPSFTVNTGTPVQQLAALDSDIVVVLCEGSAAALNGRGTLVWKLEQTHVALVRAGHGAVLLEADGGGTQLSVQSTPGGGIAAEDLFIDRAACGVGSAIGAADGLVLACGRRLLLLDQRHEVQREISLPIGVESVAHLCWAGRRLFACSRDVHSWQADDDGAAAVTLPKGQAADVTCAAVSLCGTLLAAGLSDGQVQVWQLAAADDSACGDRLLYRLPHNAAVNIVAWNSQSQQLASSDGATVSLWTIPADGQTDGTAAPAPAVCCGHQPLARITVLAFDTATSSLAIGADHGQVLVYDAAAASPGASLQPRARAAVSSFADCCHCSTTALAWLPSGALVAGCDDGRVVSWPNMLGGDAAATELQLAPAAAVSPAAAVPAAALSPAGLGTGGNSGQQQQQQRRPLARRLLAASSVAAARQSALSALAAAKQVHGASAPQQHRRSLRHLRSLRSAEAQQLSGGIMAAVASGSPASKLTGQVPEPQLPQPTQPADQTAATNGLSASSSSSQLNGSSAAADDLQEAPVQSTLPAQLSDQLPLPTCSAARPPAAGQQMQPPKTPPSARGGWPQHGNYHDSCSSHRSGSLAGSYGSNPDFLRRQPNGSSLVDGSRHALSAPSTPQHLPQHNTMNGHWSPGGVPQQPRPPFGMYVPGPMQMPVHYPPGSMAVPPSPGHGQSYMAAPPGQVAYVQPTMVPVPVYMPAAMPMGGPWVPYPSAAAYAHGSYYHLGYAAAQQSSSWHAASQQQPILLGTPPLSPSATSSDFTHLSSNATMTSPAQTIRSSAGTARPAPRGPGHRRGSRGRRTSASHTSPEGSSVELSDGSSSLKTSTGEADVAEAEAAVPVTSVYVGNLPPCVDVRMLHLAFSIFGTITSCEVVRDRSSGESRGFGFVAFAHASCAAAAMVNMAEAVLGGPFRDMPLRVAPSTRDRRAQMQQASVQSSLRAASASQEHHASTAAHGQPSIGAATVNGYHTVSQGAQDSAPQQNGLHQQSSEQLQGGACGAQQNGTEDLDGPETLEQLRNGRALTPAQQQQMRLSAAKQQFAAEQRQRLVDRARQAVSDAEAAGNDAAEDCTTAAADASAGEDSIAEPRPLQDSATAEAEANGIAESRPPPSAPQSPSQQQQQRWQLAEAPHLPAAAGPEVANELSQPT